MPTSGAGDPGFKSRRARYLDTLFLVLRFCPNIFYTFVTVPVIGDGSGTMRYEQCIGVELSGEQRRELLRLLVRPFGSIQKLAVELGGSKSPLHRLLKGERVSGTTTRIIDYSIYRLLGKDEFYLRSSTGSNCFALRDSSRRSA